jgi:hypothetical protein
MLQSRQACHRLKPGFPVIAYQKNGAENAPYGWLLKAALLKRNHILNDAYACQWVLSVWMMVCY